MSSATKSSRVEDSGCAVWFFGALAVNPKHLEQLSAGLPSFVTISL